MSSAALTISIIAIVIVFVLAISWERGERRANGPDRSARSPRSGSAYEFMSSPWIATAREEITSALSGRELDVRPFTLSEEFTDPPRHLRHGSETIGFSVRVGQGRVEVGDRPEPAADCRIISDYADALEVARDPDAGSADPAEAERRVAEGRLRIVGDPTRMPPALQQLDVHRLLARFTA